MQMKVMMWKNAHQLKKALESYGGVKNTFISLVDINTENPPVLAGNIKNFKTLDPQEHSGKNIE